MAELKEKPIGGFPAGGPRRKMCDDIYSPTFSKYNKNDFEKLLTNIYLNGVDDKHVYQSTDKYHKTWYASTVISFDTETSSVDIPFDNQQGYKHFAYVYIWQMAIQRHVIYGRYLNEFVEACDIISKVFGTDINNRVVIWVHNLSFDLNFIRRLFVWQEGFWMEPHKPLYLCTNTGIEFRCSYLLSGRSLANISGTEDIDEWTGKPKHTSILLDKRFKKKAGDLDYNLVRNPSTKLTKEELDYCLYDVLVVNEFITEVMEDGILGKKYKCFNDVPYTKTGIVRERYREGTIYSNINNIKYPYQKLMSELTMTEKEYTMAKKAFMGGFTHANYKYVNKTIDHMASIDIASSYPAVIATKKFPMTKAIEFRYMRVEDYMGMVEAGYAIIASIKFINLKPSGIFPDQTLMEYKGYSTRNLKVNNGRIYSADEATFVLTEIDFKWVSIAYDYDDIIIVNAYCYQKDYLPRPFIDTLLDLYSDKTTLKGIAGREVDYNTSKEQLNSSYGMMVTDPCQPEINYKSDIDDWIKKRDNREELVNKYNNSHTRFISYIWGIYVTAYARDKLFTMMEKIGDKYVYADTDSNKVIYFDGLEEIVEEVNNNIKLETTIASSECGIELEKYKPKDSKGKERWIGIWEIENIGKTEYKRFKTLGAKRYIYETSDYNSSRDEYIDRIHLTCSGWNKEIGGRYLNEQADPFEKFSNDLEVGIDDCGKVGHYYSKSDDLTEADVTDYLGNTEHIISPSWIYMFRCTFSMEMSDVFMDFLYQYNQGKIV